MTKLEFLMKLAIHFSKDSHDGHFTVMKFTTGWKAVFGTPDFTRNQKDAEGTYIQIAKMNSHKTIEGALEELILNRI